MLFSAPKCPIDDDERQWIEESMDWLVEKLGSERLSQADVVLPVEEAFPDEYRGTEECVHRLLDRVCEYMGVDSSRLNVLMYVHEDPLAEVRNQRSFTAGVFIRETGDSAGMGSDAPTQITIGVEASLLSDPAAVVATLAHEVGHVILSDLGLTRDAPNSEFMTDLVPVFLGLGVLTANTAFRSSEQLMGTRYEWRARRLGYLSEEMYGYALAIFALKRGEDNPDWSRYLSINVRTYLQQSLRYLKKISAEADRARNRPGGLAYWLQRVSEAHQKKVERADDYLDRAVTQMRKERYDMAIAELDRAIAIAPSWDQPYYRRGLAYCSTGEGERGIADFNRAIELGGALPEVLRARGNAYRQTGQYEQAIEDYGQAIKAKAQFAEAYYDRGILMMTLQRIDAAQADFEKALQFSRDPELQRTASEKLVQLSDERRRVLSKRRRR